MSKLLLPMALIAALSALAGCSMFSSKKPKSSAHMYEGDAPTIHYSDKPEAAGGALNPY